ncbi:type 1 glutamine amidotransferase domain-containing protein [Paenibacillus glycinis]|uniref:Type 1 glutamine amidotransferase domain-containing protein n=1 Tax=Paenibacillus glycinis TaxID=2697035 RepID=A0ABW9XK71_9BACL|nr:type 1 glutamine amidotransferase domain-containing protein [Paenibacillus glycinis]NBD23004.1 type 1 glutamine amidotransferase domain-containing protein [Paenibacillus glycinis]
MTKRILMVLTSADRMSDTEQTGLWLSEFAEPFAAFSKQGCEVTIASILGGRVPVDHRSLNGAPQDVLDAAVHLQHTVKLDNVDDSGSFDAVFIPGGHGCMFDMPDHELLQSIIRAFYESGRVVAAVCHGPAALVGARLSDGTPLVGGKTIATFTDEEERETTLDRYMPFLLETKLRQLGANIVLTPNWTTNVQVDGHLITGQNPQSAQRAAEEVIRKLAANEKG